MEKENPFKELADMIKEDFKRCGGIDKKGYYIQGIQDRLYFVLFTDDENPNGWKFNDD